MQIKGKKSINLIIFMLYLTFPWVFFDNCNFGISSYPMKQLVSVNAETMNSRVIKILMHAGKGQIGLQRLHGMTITKINLAYARVSLAQTLWWNSDSAAFLGSYEAKTYVVKFVRSPVRS